MPNSNGGDLLQVKLEVLDKGDSVTDHWLLPIEHVSSELSRQPVIFSIPHGASPNNSDGSINGNFDHEKRPWAYALDFGMMNEMISFTGVSPDNNPDETQPSAHQLREIVRTHWWSVKPGKKLSSGQGMTGGVRITLDEGPGQGVHSYQGVILSFASDRDGGVPRWQWKMTLQVCNWPEDMHT